MDMGGGRQRAVRDGGGVGPGRLGDGPRLAVLRDALADGRAVRLAGAPDPTPSRARSGLRLVQAARLGRRAHPRGVLERRAAAVTIPVILSRAKNLPEGFFTEPALSLQSRCFAALSMTGEGFRMTLSIRKRPAAACRAAERSA